MEIVMSLLVVAVFFSVVFLVWWNVFNSPRGERYMRMRTQGPFVPVDSSPSPESEQPAQAIPETTLVSPKSYAEAEKILTDAKRARPQRVLNPFSLFNHPQLRRLDPSVRLEVVNQARRNFRRSIWLNLALVLYALIFLVLYFKTSLGSSYSLVSAIANLGGMAMIVLNHLLFRREAIKLAQAIPPVLIASPE